MSEPLIRGRAGAKVIGTVEVVRSFAYKHNAGNYESRDFFCSQKAECKLEDAEHVSEALYSFCKQQVMRAVEQFLKDQPIRRAS